VPNLAERVAEAKDQALMDEGESTPMDSGLATEVNT